MSNQTYLPRKTNRQGKHRISNFLQHREDKTFMPEKIRNYCVSPTSFPRCTSNNSYEISIQINDELFFNISSFNTPIVARKIIMLINEGSVLHGS